MKLDKFDIKPHELKHPIEIQKGTQGQDEDYIAITIWNPYFNTKAKILNVRGSEFSDAQSEGSEIEKTFFIRTRRNQEVTEEDRVIYKGVAYDIEYANDIQEAGVFTEIKAKLVK